MQFIKTKLELVVEDKNTNEHTACYSFNSYKGDIRLRFGGEGGEVGGYPLMKMFKC